ncbi:butyrophilin-like protein 2 [Maylandia zebra]|uniref:butyrophilin-like protein 2 n=1 Tax=Maylandia zebra TaxID=106582 RepID=UPI00403CBBB4
MSAVTASLCSTLMFVLFVSADPKIITAESGQDVTLTCRAANNKIIVVKWSRADLGDKYVFLYRDGHFVPDDLHPSFKNRVDLQDRQMKDGDVSLILKDVTINDAGSYECRVVQRVRGPMTLINSTNLTVVDPPGLTGGQEKDEDKEKEDGSFGLKVGLSVSAVLLLAAVGFLIYRRCKPNPADPHVAEHLQHEYKTITAESGQDVTLTCRAANNKITAVKWSRADLRDKYVLLYRDGHVHSDGQHPSFKNRVDLQDGQMKDGDVSLILKDVTINDAGTYECRVCKEETDSLKFIFRRIRKRRKRANLKTDPISIIYLRVDPPGKPGGLTED